MNKKKIDLRQPELYLKSNSQKYSQVQMQHAEHLGEQYRKEKKALKKKTELKKTLSKQFKTMESHEKTEEIKQQLKIINDKTKKIKLSLKKIEADILNSFVTDLFKKNTLPPQFSSRKNKPLTSIIKIIELDEYFFSEWDHYVNAHPNATIYHSLNIKRVIDKTFGHRSCYLIAISHTSEICGIYPLINQASIVFGNLWTSLPYFNYAGVLADNKLIEKALIEYAWEKLKISGCHYVETRQSHLIEDKPVRDEKISMVLRLPKTVELLQSAIGAKLRAQINKTKAYNIQFKVGREDLLDDFYRVFSIKMRDLGTPVYAKSLFLNMLVENPNAKIVSAYINNQVTSVGFIIGWRNTLEIPWASTLSEANQFNSNMALYWHILKLAIEEQYEFFDFGRSSKDSTTYQFKKQWGAEEHQLYWHYSLPDQSPLPAINNNNPKYKLAISIWKRLPVWLTQIIGPCIVKYIP